jgi:hypothetical protein
MFGLIPEVTPRDRKILFWNFSKLYENIPNARDWSAYLSEREDETEFKFGDYAQNNIMRYKDSDDVIKDNGMGVMQVDDVTLPFEKDALELPVSTCDEVTILTNNFSVNVSRIAFNTFKPDNVKIVGYTNLAAFPTTGAADMAYHANDTGVYYIWSGGAYVIISLPSIISLQYDQEKSIDPRIVYVERTKEEYSPPYEKKLIFSPTKILSGVIEIDSPKKASSLEVSFSYLVTNYGSLSRLLTKTNLRKAKFNLPVYEVAGLKHYIPIYLSQYKAYFYVNKINNYVPGQLCKIDLIKL